MTSMTSWGGPWPCLCSRTGRGCWGLALSSGSPRCWGCAPPSSAPPPRCLCFPEGRGQQKEDLLPRLFQAEVAHIGWTAICCNYNRIEMYLSHLCRRLEPADEAVLPAERVQLGLLGRQLVGLIGQENSWNRSPVVQGHLRREEQSEWVTGLENSK